MAALVLKKLPDDLHKLLREQAERNRRSMAQEAITILERSLASVPPVKLSKRLIEPLKPISRGMVLNAIKAGRK